MLTTASLLSQLPQIPKFNGLEEQDGEMFQLEEFESVAVLGNWDDYCKLINHVWPEMFDRIDNSKSLKLGHSIFFLVGLESLTCICNRLDRTIVLTLGSIAPNAC